MSDIGALIIERKLGERFYIGDEIEVKIHKVKGNRVWARIVAPKDLHISREEHIRDEPTVKIPAKARTHPTFPSRHGSGRQGRRFAG